MRFSECFLSSARSAPLAREGAGGAAAAPPNPPAANDNGDDADGSSSSSTAANASKRSRMMGREVDIRGSFLLYWLNKTPRRYPISKAGADIRYWPRLRSGWAGRYPIRGGRRRRQKRFFRPIFDIQYLSFDPKTSDFRYNFSLENQKFHRKPDIRFLFACGRPHYPSRVKLHIAKFKR